MIDHVFTDMGPESLQRAYIPVDARLADHVPVVGEFEIPKLGGSRSKRAVPTLPVKFDLSSEDKRLEIQAALEKASTALLAEEGLTRTTSADQAGHQLEYISRRLGIEIRRIDKEAQAHKHPVKIRLTKGLSRLG